MNPRLHQARLQTRRHFLHNMSTGIGGIALASLVGNRAFSRDAQRSAANPLSPKQPPLPSKAKSVIYLHMSGGPPQQELFDYKPKLKELHMQPCPESLLKGQRFAFIKGTPKMLGSPYQFHQHGKAGAWFSELLPHLSQHADDIAFLKGMNTDQFNHAPAELLVYTGSPRNGGAAMGSWVTYGLGTENEDLPGFVVLISGGTDPTGGKALWSSGFLPSVYQGVQCRSAGEPILYLNDPAGMDRKTRRDSLDTLDRLNEIEARQFGDPETVTRIQQYELAYRMQIAVPEVMDISKEPAAIQEMYGAKPGDPTFANNCLLARRLVEKGVRYVQLYDWGWDIHGTGTGDDLMTAFPRKCKEMDRAAAALVKDLKQRGLLDETLVVWGGEFGRTPMNEARGGSKYLGRDHHARAFTMWLAGGGIKPGVTIGKTDDVGYNIVKDPISVHDLHATMLHLMGIDHTKLTYNFQGRDFRLTDVEGAVIDRLLA